MKTKRGNFLGTFVLVKLPNKLTASQWFTVVSKFLFQSQTAHFYKGEMAIFYSPKSAKQFMTNITRNWAVNASVSFNSNRLVRQSNEHIHLNQFEIHSTRALLIFNYL